jgi:uncharacterized membrane protein YdfJ with MMPL/SSD domain
VQPSRNIAARAGRWSAGHRKTAIFGWLAFVIAAFVIGGQMIGSTTLTKQEAGVGQSGRADVAAFKAFPKKADESVLIHSDTLEASSPQFRAAVADVMQRLDAARGVEHVTGPYADGGAGVSPDAHSALVDYELPGDATVTRKSVEVSLAATEAAARAHPDFQIDAFGSASSEKEFMAGLNKDLHKAELTSLPLTLLILLIAFGSLWAAGIPVLLSISAVLLTMGLLGPLSSLSPVSDSINSVVLLIGLAVGVDYCLFYIRRGREERDAGRSAEAALEAAAATSGRAVLISGFTVMTAMSGMYLAGAADFRSYATGTIVVVAMAMLGSVTVLPALLSKLGDRVQPRRFTRVKAKVAAFGLWGRVVDRVLKRPALSAIVSTGVLVALAIPAFGMHLAPGGDESLPRDMAVVQTFDRVKAAFPSEGSSAAVVIEAADVTAAPVAAAIDRLGDETAAQPKLFPGSTDVEISPDKSVAVVNVPTAGTDDTGAEANRALDALRDDVVPATLGQVQGVEANVTGGAAQNRDFVDSMVSHLPVVFLFVLSMAFLLLLITFRSVVIPLKAIALNLLSVGAAYGVLVMVFQHGFAGGLLGVHGSDSIVPWLPLFLFVILFGLSMDYHVFILSRIREAYDRGMSTEDAVADGIKSTAGVVTSAAVVMVGVFSIFATLSLLDFKQLGVGLAVAVLIDATIVRGVLLPATMKLLGDWNWWLPRSLGWLPRVATEEPAAAPATA